MVKCLLVDKHRPTTSAGTHAHCRAKGDPGQKPSTTQLHSHSDVYKKVRFTSKQLLTVWRKEATKMESSKCRQGLWSVVCGLCRAAPDSCTSSVLCNTLLDWLDYCEAGHFASTKGKCITRPRLALPDLSSPPARWGKLALCSLGYSSVLISTS